LPFSDDRLSEWQSLDRTRLSPTQVGSDPIGRRIAYALENGFSLEILYATPNKPLSRRVIWPKAAERVHGSGSSGVYIRAYCEMRGEERTFRLDRIRNARVPDGPPEYSSQLEPLSAGSRAGRASRGGGCLLVATLAACMALLATAVFAALL